LNLADAAIGKATIDGEPARVIFDAANGYRLLYENKTKGAKKIELLLEYAKAIQRAPGRNSVSFQAPRAAVSRWRVRVPESGVKVNIDPMIAATEVPVAEADETTDGEEPEGEAPAATDDQDGAEAEGADETVLMAFVGSAPRVTIQWTPKAEGATDLEALATAKADQQLWVSEGLARSRAELVYSISRAELKQLTMLVPADQKVVNVVDANVRKWTVEPVEGDEGRQRVAVELFEPAREKQQIVVEMERFLKEDESRLNVPMVEAVGVGRQQGTVAVQIAEELRAEVAESTGLFQIDGSELPGGAPGGGWDFAFGYATLPFSLDLSLEKVEPRITVQSRADAYLEPETLTLALASVFTVERRGVFRLELEMPSGYEVHAVRGRQIDGAQPVHVESYSLQGEDESRLVVNLTRKAIGRVGLEVRVQRRLQHPELLSPTESEVTVPIGVPRVAPETREQAVGSLVVHAPESLRINPSETEGLRAVSFGEANQAPSAGGRGPGGVRPVLAFRYASQPVSLAVSAQRRKPRVTVAQVLQVKIEEGVAKYRARFLYEIRYSGVKSLRIDVPRELAERLRNDTPGIREKREPSPEDEAPPEGYSAWIFSGESELFGDQVLVLSWERRLEELEIGKPVEMPVPRLIPAAVDRAWGQIVLAKTETIDVTEAEGSTGLRPIDPQHDLVPGAGVSAAARAFEFHDDWSLSIEVTRYELEDVKRTAIERALVRSVVTRGGEVSVQALFRVRSARQRLEVALPEGAEFDTDPLRIDGRPVMLERGQQNRYFLPLVEPDPDEPFVLELRYTNPGDGTDLVLPEFLEDPAVQKVYVAAYLPPEWALLCRRGPWNEQFEFTIDPAIRWTPRGQPSADTLISWVCENADEAKRAAATFQTDGQAYLFATLKPSPPPQGTLRLYCMNENWLHVAVFALVFLGGVLLLPVGVSGRALAVGVAIVVLVLAGVFYPIFAMQILDDILALAAFIVVVLWTVKWFMGPGPRRWYEAALAQVAKTPTSKQEKEPAAAGPPDLPAGKPQEGDAPEAAPDAGDAERSHGQGPEGDQGPSAHERTKDDQPKRPADEGGRHDD
jgi:hypothetical protein